MKSAARRATAPEAQQRKPLLSLSAGVALVGVLLASMSNGSGPGAAYGAGALLVAVCALPIVSWRRRPARGLPMFELICLSYAAQYALPLYLQPNQLIVNSRAIVFSWGQALQANVLITLGIAAMVVSYYAVKRALASRGDLRVDLPLPGDTSTRYIAVGLAVGLVALALADFGLSPAGTSGLGAFFRVAADQTYVAIALLGLAVYRRELQARWILALYASVVVAALLGLLSGLLENALIPLVVLAIVYWRGRGRPPLRLFLVGIVLFVLLDSVKTEYRSQVWYGGQQTGVAGKLGLWASLAGAEVGHLVTGGSAAQLGPLVQNAGARLDLLHTFMYVHETTPQTVPYFDGSTYSYLAYGWIPRVLWPDKPQAQSNAIAAVVDYGLLAPGSSTSIGLGQPAEAYANFGALGVVIVLALEGMFFAVLDHVLNGPQSQGGAAVYLTVMVFFLNGIGSQTAAVFGSMIQDVVAMAIVLVLVVASRCDLRGRAVASHRVRAVPPALRREL